MAAYQILPASGPATIERVGLRKAAPGFSLRDSNGAPVRLSDYRGKVVLLNFWETSCVPCRVEIPWLIDFQQTYRDRDFAVLGVSIDEDGWQAVKPYMKKNGVNYRMTVANDDVTRAYELEATPTTVMIDKSGRVAATHVGLIAKNGYKAEIQAMLAER